MAISERKIEERKNRQELILSSALEVFKVQGLENSTMEEIALKAGFGKATLYYYFRSKEDVFSGILENGWQMLWFSLEPIISPNTSPRETFVQILLKIAENIQVFQLHMMPEEVPDLEELFFKLSKIIDFNESKRNNLIKRLKKRKP